jgi:hypothetical protein
MSTLSAWFPGWVSQKYYFPSWFGLRFHKMGKIISYVTYITILIIKDKHWFQFLQWQEYWNFLGDSLGFRGLGFRASGREAKTTFCCSIWYGNLKLELKKGFTQIIEYKMERKLGGWKREKKGKTQCRHYISMVSFTSPPREALDLLPWYGKCTGGKGAMIWFNQVRPSDH